MEYQEILAKVEALKIKKSRAEGRLEKQLSELKEKFGFDSLEKAEKGLKHFQTQRNEAEEKMEAEMEAFLKKWGDKL